NGYMLLQAGDFYSSAKNDKAPGAFLKAAEKFLAERNPVYSSHALKKVLKEVVLPADSLRALRLFPEISAMHLDMELLELAYEKCSKLKDELSENEKKSVESVAWGLVNLLRDYSRGREMLDMYGKIAGKDYSYLMLKAKIAEESENLRAAFTIYGNIKKNIKMTLKEEFDYLTAVSALIFFKTIKREELKKNLKKLAEKQKKLRDDFSTMQYYGLIISIYLHTNELEKAEKFAKLHMRLAKKHKQIDSIGSLYNSFAIINSNKFFITGEKKYEKKALRYHKKVFDTVKKDMRMNDMPLMVTNLGNSYMAAGDAKNCMKCFYEGLLYGQEIDHPVEVPYNMILIMLFIYERGGYGLGYKLADAVIDYKHKIDISTAALILKYLQTKDRSFHDKGVKMAKELLGAMNTPPYQMYIDIMFNHFYRRGDAGEILKIKGKIEKFVSKTKLREVSRHKCIMMMTIADIENERINRHKAEAIILKEEKSGMKTLALLQLCFSLGKMLERKKERKKAIQFMLKSLKISKRLCYFNYSLMIEEHLADIGYRKKHFQSKAKRDSEIMKKMENLKTIEDFAIWFQNN
ncbi:MAG: hypothetical protein PHW02_07450, partial [bacterium]|nr:hypothetical protein [bacterium]